jgi:hypothetical protein
MRCCRGASSPSLVQPAVHMRMRTSPNQRYFFTWHKFPRELKDASCFPLRMLGCFGFGFTELNLLPWFPQIQSFWITRAPLGCRCQVRVSLFPKEQSLYVQCSITRKIPDDDDKLAGNVAGWVHKPLSENIAFSESHLLHPPIRSGRSDLGCMEQIVPRSGNGSS